jgi:hypothetical protein
VGEKVGRLVEMFVGEGEGAVGADGVGRKVQSSKTFGSAEEEEEEKGDLLTCKR